MSGVGLPSLELVNSIQGKIRGVALGREMSSFASICLAANCASIFFSWERNGCGLPRHGNGVKKKMIKTQNIVEELPRNPSAKVSAGQPYYIYKRNAK